MKKRGIYQEERTIFHHLTFKKYDLKSNPKGRHLHTQVAYKDYIYVFGGYNGQEMAYLNDVNMFDSTLHKWKHIKASKLKPSPRHSHSAVVYRNCMYVWGGIYEGIPLNDMYTFDLDKHKWKQILPENEPPEGTWGHSAVVFGSKMYIFGGRGNTFNNYLFEFDFGTHIWGEILQDSSPVPRQFHSSVVHRRNMYVYGGFQNRNLCDFFKYSFGTAIHIY
eukprot:TRINITY_DN2751_c0_g1_i3.p1 TRINITY_DN2751_c0_g1~~TRINITY_DN2751_c0_g1_i3.p1  ORF type:complete len:220 (-),score=41.55 TRINITY_DN2751_c0_g1_i3:625-1284(-)